MDGQDRKIAIIENRRNWPPSFIRSWVKQWLIDWWIREVTMSLSVVIAKTSASTGCLSGKAPPTANGEPLVQGISSELLQVMKTNLRTIPGLKWQYFGNTDGVMFSYPADDTCGLPTYDPRLRFIHWRTIILMCTSNTGWPKKVRPLLWLLTALNAWINLHNFC